MENYRELYGEVYEKSQREQLSYVVTMGS
jgi:hypothetical protein